MSKSLISKTIFCGYRTICYILVLRVQINGQLFMLDSSDLIQVAQCGVDEPLIRLRRHLIC